MPSGHFAIAEARTLIYSPTSRLIESGPTTPGAANAVRINRGRPGEDGHWIQRASAIIRRLVYQIDRQLFNVLRPVASSERATSSWPMRPPGRRLNLSCSQNPQTCSLPGHSRTVRCTLRPSKCRVLSRSVILAAAYVEQQAAALSSLRLVEFLVKGEVSTSVLNLLVACAREPLTRGFPSTLPRLPPLSVCRFCRRNSLLNPSVYTLTYACIRWRYVSANDWLGRADLSRGTSIARPAMLGPSRLNSPP